LTHFYQHAGVNKVLAPICAGGETAIDWGLYNTTLTASPTSADVLTNAGYEWSGDLVNWYAGGRYATVVMGLDPTAHYAWTTRIGWVLNNFRGSPSDEPLSSSIAVARAQYTPLTNINQLMADENIHSWAYPSNPVPADLRVAIVLSRGASDFHAEYSYQCLGHGHAAVVDIVCPGWELPEVQCDSNMRPVSLAQCSVSLDDLAADASADYDLYIIPGGVWSTTVLRSGDERDKLSTVLNRSTGVILTMGEAVEVPIAAGMLDDVPVCPPPDAVSNAYFGGARVMNGACQVSEDTVISARGDDRNSNVIALDFALSLFQ
ncbi:hypothetical protein KIPB_003799, partial [Kipferlia bialata]